MFPKDLVLEGIRPADIVALRRLRQGDLTVSDNNVRRLEAKGWVDLPSGVPLITLTGGAVLDKSSSPQVEQGAAGNALAAPRGATGPQRSELPSRQEHHLRL